MRWRRAACAIYVDGHRSGTGTLVTDSHVLTAAHVVRRDGPVTIRFLDSLSGEAIPVERLPLARRQKQLDIAVLDLVPGSGRQAAACDVVAGEAPAARDEGVRLSASRQAAPGGCGEIHG